MKLSSLFNLVTDAQDVLDLFEGVKNTDQLRGRLRRVSNIEAEDLLTCLHSLQSSIARALDDTLEMNPDLDDPDDGLGEVTPSDPLLDELGDPADGTEDQNPEAPVSTEK